jgi:hypothetical protein
MNLEEIETGARRLRPLDALRIFDTLAEHLIAGADAEHSPAATHVRKQVDVPTLPPEEFEICDRRFAAGKDDEIRIERQRPPRCDEFELHPGLEAQGIEVVEVGDVREMGNGDAYAGVSAY